MTALQGGAMKRILVALGFLAFASHASAEKLSLGSRDIEPCSKSESAAVRWGKERATLFLEISAPHFQRVHDELKQCAASGVAAATLDALLKNLPAAAPEFWAEFEVCSRYTEWLDADLVVETACHY
jgi:hypothetical protein